MTEEIVQGNTQLARVEDDRFTVRELMREETQDAIVRVATDAVACEAFIPAGMSIAQAAVVIRAGLEIGLPPMAALKSVYLVHNRAGLESKAMLALLRRRPDMGYYLWGDCGPQKATLLMYVRTPRGEYVEQPYTFTMEEAQRAGLLKSQMYNAWPEVMLRNRVAAIAMRSSFPDLLLGCAYTPDEIGAPVRVEGMEVVVDEEAYARGEVVDVDYQHEAGVVDAGLAQEPGEIDFEDSGGAGQPLHEPEPDPAEAFRREAQEFVGTILESLLPPEPWPAWADEIPDTIKQLGEKIIGIEPLLKGDPGKALIRLAKQGDHAETWTLIRSWWKDGELPGKLFEALCQAQGVEPEPNPFLSAPEPQDEQDEDAFGDQ